MVNLEHLQVIETICREGSFQKASEKLFKARSAVSYSVKQVERHYDMQIFNRDTYRPELTPEGRLLLVKIRQLLRQAGEFDAYVDELKGESETELRLGVTSAFPLSRITDLLTSLKRDFPHTTIHLNIEVASGERMLLNDEVDLGIYGTLGRHGHIDYQRIDTLDIPLVISSTLPLADRQQVTEADLADYPQVILTSSDRQSPDTGILDDALKWYVSDQQAKIALIKAGLGWGRLPRHLVADEIAGDELICLDTLGPMALPIYIARQKHRVMGPVARRIWRHFQSA